MNAIITGATKGMGRAIALVLAEAGYNIAICARSQPELDDLCDEIKKNYQVQAIGLQTDCSNSDQLNRFADFVQQHFPTVEVLVNNAGMYIPGTILDEPDNLLQKQMQLNLFAAHSLCRIFGKKMREDKNGHIFNICSIAAIKPVITAGSYTVTKVALLGLTRVLRDELMPYNVKVTAILPGSTLTASWEGTDLPPDRFVTASDVANAILASLKMSKGANVDEVVIRPLKGEI
jgi:3-oxoacyl-[acyl-carrier protein] reductase